jgi:hypothetical protein
MGAPRRWGSTHGVDARANGGADGQGEEKPKEEYDVYIDLLLYCGPFDRRSPMPGVRKRERWDRRLTSRSASALFRVQ